MLVYEELETFDEEVGKDVLALITSQNQGSLIDNLGERLGLEFLCRCVESKDVIVVVAKHGEVIIGYGILGRNPGVYSECLAPMKRAIIGLLVRKFRLLAILNAVLRATGLDECLMSRARRRQIKENPHFTYMAIHPTHQSKGYGSHFFEKMLELVRSRFGGAFMSVETSNPDTMRFFTDKIGFSAFGIKISIPRSMRLFTRPLD